MFCTVYIKSMRVVCEIGFGVRVLSMKGFMQALARKTYPSASRQISFHERDIKQTSDTTSRTDMERPPCVTVVYKTPFSGSVQFGRNACCEQACVPHLIPHI